MTQVVIETVADEIEEKADVGIADSLGVGLVAFGESIQKPQDINGCYLVDLEITEYQAELINDRLIGSNRVFLGMGLVVIDPDCGRFLDFHGDLLW